jgi:hypothetical protein
MIAVVVSGCVHTVETDLDTYLKNKEEFEGKQVIFKTDLQDLSQRYEMYRGKVIELTSPVTYFGNWNFWTWYLILDDGENNIRAYESGYRLYPDRYAINLLQTAKKDEGDVTIQGKLEKNGIELNRIYYKDFAVNTNLKTRKKFWLYY